MTAAFPCVSCGICCRNLHETMYAELRLPDGTCKYYDAGGRSCTIYDNRPLKCRVDDYYDRYLAQSMDRDRYYAMNIRACKQMMLQEEDYESLDKLDDLLHQSNRQ